MNTKEAYSSLHPHIDKIVEDQTEEVPNLTVEQKVSGYSLPYGTALYGRIVMPEKGYRLLAPGEKIKKDDRVFDVYAGWWAGDGWHAQNQCYARSAGRWTAWERKL